MGTGTEVGKTWVTVALIAELRRSGWSVAVRKPVQSFEPGEATDAELLAAATGETAEQVCPPHRWYDCAMAPPLAADALQRPAFTLADLLGELAWPPGVDVGLVETVGGVRSPLAGDGDAIDLVAALDPDRVVLVAGASLGTLNLVRLSVDAVNRSSVVVHLNRYDPSDDLHRRNREWVVQHLGLATTTSPAALVDVLGLA